MRRRPLPTQVLRGTALGVAMLAAVDGLTGVTPPSAVIAAPAAVLATGGWRATTLESSQRVVPDDARWSLAIQRGSAGLQRIEHEIRAADGVDAATPNSIDLRLGTGGRAMRVRYSCDVAEPGTVHRQCVRVQVPVRSSLPGRAARKPVVVRLLNGTAADPVFTFAPDGATPTFVTITLRLAGRRDRATSAGDSHAIVLSDAVHLRYRSPGT